MDADTVARELYALRPGEFVAARDAKAAEARGAGDRALASEIKSMRRPTVSAWVTNLFALERGNRLEQLFSLGDALRAAQASLAGDELRRLDEQRRQVIAALAGEAAALAAEHGQAVPAQVVADVEQTLYAALADPDAAESVKAGRLTTGLSYTGFGSASDAPDTTRRARGRDAGKKQSARRDDRRRERLREDLQAAEDAFETASGTVERARRELEDASTRRDQRAQAVDELESQLADARSQLDDADRDVSDAGDAVEHAEEALGDARSAVESARAELATD
jgi:hypothetical protein